ncbi:MAG: glycosyltransferase family 4 protein [Chloroflexi bacterium]|nr:glycosyltransferase family 4 protein [Chloroflexota bacterium]
MTSSPIPLLFTTVYTGMGGGETSLMTLVEHLVRHDARYQPHLLIPGEGELGRRWAANGWPVHVDSWRGATVYFIPEVWGSFPIAGRMARLIREQGIRAVHSDYHSLPFALAAARRTRVPIAWTCWGWWFQPKPYQQHFFRRPDLTLASSGAIKEGFLGNPPFMPPERVQVLPPGVDTERFHPGIDGVEVRSDAGVSLDAPLVALIARFQNVKGHEVFQAMAQQVVEVIPEARFIVAGENVHGQSADDAYKARILAAHRDNPALLDRLVYLGFRSDAERVIGAADVVVCSSHFESYGMVNVEAMACGVPVVSTRRGGPSETVVDGETGFLVDGGDAHALAERVIQLLRDPALRQRMGTAGRARVEAQFAADVMAARFAAALEPLIGRE